MKGKKGDQTLTIKRRKFAEEYIKTSNATEAYKAAYDTHNMKEQTIQREAKKTTHLPPVKDYIAKRMDEIWDSKIPKVKEILSFLGGIVRGTEKQLIVTKDGDEFEVPAAMKDRISAAKELLKRYPQDDPLTQATLRKLTAEAELAESKTNESQDKTGKLMAFMDKQTDTSLQKIIDSIEDGDDNG